MSDPLDLQGLEQRTWRERLDDGLMDLVLGLYLVTLGLVIRTGFSGLAAVIPAVGIAMWPVLHRAITVPRLGAVEFSAERRGTVARNKRVMVIVLTFTLVLGIGAFFAYAGMPDWGRSLRDAGIIPFGVVLSFVVFVAALLLKVGRGLAYASLILAAFVVGGLADVDPRLFITATGAVIAAVGAVMLVRFLRDHPLPQPGEGHDAV